jgi:hypothetical protein
MTGSTADSSFAEVMRPTGARVRLKTASITSLCE